MEMEGLSDEASLKIFALWYSFGGLQRGLSPAEIEGMSQARMADFQYLLHRLGEMRRRRRAQDAARGKHESG